MKLDPCRGLLRATGHNPWVLNVTPGPIGGLHSKQLNGNIRLEMKFASALAANVTMLLLW